MALHCCRALLSDSSASIISANHQAFSKLCSLIVPIAAVNWVEAFFWYQQTFTCIAMEYEWDAPNESWSQNSCPECSQTSMRPHWNPAGQD